MEYLVVALVFAAVVMAVWALLAFFFAEDRSVTRRLGQMTQYQQSEVMSAEPLLKPFKSRVVDPATDTIGRFGRWATPSDYLERLRHRLVLAGAPRGLDAERLVTLKIIFAAGTLLAAAALSILRGASLASWVLGIGTGLLVFFLPDLWLTSRVRRRQTRIRRDLPDMLDMLTISVEAGLGFDQAISKLVRNSDGPLAVEFGHMLQEIQVGIDRADALRGLTWRTEVSELSSFITAILQADVFGISVANVLRTQATEMRLKRRQFAEEAAQKAPVKMVFPLILCILPATLIVVLGPAIVSIGKAFGLID
jgi:tight adherence protein C